MTAVAEEAKACPKCGRNMWDNRLSKKNPKAPDYKCKDAGCDGVIWPPKNGNGAAPAAAPRPVATTKQPTSLGGPLPWEQEETGAAPVARADVPASFALYDRCFEHAYKVATSAKITDQQAIASMAATIFIQASK